MWQKLVILLVFFSLESARGIKLEIAGVSDPVEYPNCDHVDLKEERFLRCVCMDGVWAFLVVQPGRGDRWEVDGGGGTGGGNECSHLGQWVRHMYRLSPSVNKSALALLHAHSTLFSVNGRDWEVSIDSKRVCVQGAIAGSYCRYDDITEFSNPVEKCSEGSQVLEPSECLRFDPKLIETDGGFGSSCNVIDSPQDVDVIPGLPRDDLDPIQALASNDDDVDAIPVVPRAGFHPRANFFGDNIDMMADVPLDEAPMSMLSRVKRQEDGGEAAAGGGGEPGERNITAEADAEYLSPQDRENYKGNADMMESISDVMLKRVAKILGLDHGRKRRIAMHDPAVTLLQICAVVMKKICTAINPVVLEVAMESFLQMQKNYLLLKEPYIGYSQYERILHSLETCADHAGPFEFFQNDTSVNDSIICEKQEPPVTTAWMFDKTVDKDDKGYIRLTKEIPDYAASDPNIHEPVTEIVWKMFVNTHSYCYKYFKTYYNDHHTFTVTLMPFFTNSIQDIWYTNGTNYTSASNSSGALNYSTPIVWYGNLFGNLSRLYWDIDHCYSASRTAFNDYPWFMNRPPRDFTNEWTRRKRAIDVHQAPCASGTSSAGSQDSFNLKRNNGIHVLETKIVK